MYTTIDKAWVAGLVGGLATVLAAVSGIELGANMQTAIVGVVWSAVQMWAVWQMPNK